MRSKILSLRKELLRLVQPYQQIILKITITILSALMIGAVFGTFVLQLSHEEESHLLGETSASKDIGNETTLSGMTIYVVQAGLYQNSDNARSALQELTKQGQAAFVWQKKEEYYLFTSLAKTEGKIQEKRRADQTYFVKEWTIKERKAQLTHEEKMFFEAFYRTMDEALRQVDEGIVEMKEWKALLTKTEDSPLIQTFEETIHKGLAKKIIKTETYEEFLFELLHLYENIENHTK